MKQSRFWMGMVMLAIAGCGTPSVSMQGKPPVIQNIQGEGPDVRVGGGIRLKSQVMSETGTLTYTWKAENGLVATPTESSTMWIAPDEVPFTPYPVAIQLIVKDEYGRSAKAIYQLRVHR